MIVPAETRSSWARCGVWRLASPTVRGWWARSSRVRARSRSFQTKTKSMMAKETIPGDGQGQGDAPEHVEPAGAVDPRRLQQVLGDLGEERAQHEDRPAGAEGGVDKGDAQVLLRPGVEAEGAEPGQHRDQDDLHRHDHGGDEQEVGRRLEPERHPGVRVGGQRPGRHRQHHRQAGDDEAVDHVPGQPLVPGPGEVAEGQVGQAQVPPAVAGLRQRQGRDHQGAERRHQPHHGQDGEGPVEQQGRPPAPSDRGHRDLPASSWRR